MLKCSSCGKIVSDDAKFCPECGSSVFEIVVEKTDDSSNENKGFDNTSVGNSVNTTSSNSKRSYIKKPINPNTTPGFVLGIISFCLCIIPFVGIVPGIIGIVKSIGAWDRENKYEPTSKPALGLCFSILGIVFSIVFTGFIIAALNGSPTDTSTTSAGSIFEYDESAKEESTNAELVESLPTEQETISPEEIKEAYIASCEKYDYKAIERDPDNYKGKNVFFSGEVIQVLETTVFGSTVITLRIKEEYDYDKIWYVTYYKKDGESRILEDDYVTVYGKCDGVTSYTAVLGNPITIPSVKAEYINLTEFSETSSSSPTSSDDNSLSGTTGEMNALKTAKGYLSYSAFSYEGLKNQLKYEQYTDEEITFAVDNCDADWNEQALKQAKGYLDYSAFSYKGLMNQLEYEKFTSDQIQYAVDNCGADWNEQAVKSAKNYLDYGSFSRAELKNQLIYEGFTDEQAEYAVSEVYQ